MRFAQSGARCGPQQEFHCRNYPRHTRNPGPPIGHVTAIPRFWLAETLTTLTSCVPGQNLFRINHPNYLILSDAGDCKLMGSGLVSCEAISFLIGHSAVKLEYVWQEEELGRCIWSYFVPHPNFRLRPRQKPTYSRFSKLENVLIIWSKDKFWMKRKIL